MKKFLSKLSVMITFLSVAVAVLILYICMLARPVSIGMAYSGKVNISEFETMKATFKFKNSKRLVCELEFDAFKVTVETWYFREDNKIKLVGLAKNVTELDESIPVYTKTQYNEIVEEYNTYSDSQKEAYFQGAAKINAFSIKEEDGTTMTCKGAIVFTVIMGIFEVALITFATLSTVFFIKSKKNSKNANNGQTENAVNDKPEILTQE